MRKRTRRDVRKAIKKVNLLPFEAVWDNGFRQIRNHAWDGFWFVASVPLYARST